jgi:uncharacterized membrane protein
MLFILMVPAIINIFIYSRREEWNRYYFHGGILAGLAMAYVALITWGWIVR